jgi:hypothetical protein
MATKPTPLSTFANMPAPTISPPHRPAVESAAPTHTAAPTSAQEEKARQKVFRLTPAQDRKLKEYCAHSDTTIQDVVIEGINMVLKSKGLPPI